MFAKCYEKGSGSRVVASLSLLSFPFFGQRFSTSLKSLANRIYMHASSFFSDDSLYRSRVSLLVTSIFDHLRFQTTDFCSVLRAISSLSLLRARVYVARRALNRRLQCVSDFLINWENGRRRQEESEERERETSGHQDVRTSFSRLSCCRPPSLLPSDDSEKAATCDQQRIPFPIPQSSGVRETR